MKIITFDSVIWPYAGKRKTRIMQSYFCVDQPTKESMMAWSKPEATDLRFGFEVTMYIFNR
jgi:coenzyme PQQ precursor peptide PqqA